jgi:4-hydroxy-tetrahydrodipicolinate synthase
MRINSIVAIVTPMHEDGSLDLAGYRSLIDWHIESGTAAIVAVGTTGESPTVDVDEHASLISVAVEQAAGRVPVIAGTGGNSTREAVDLTRHAAKVGAAASLQVVPYYNKPGQEGLYRHFREVAETGGLPVILYNVPGRTVADLSNDTTVRLSQVPGIIGLKDATGDMPRAFDLLDRLPDDFALYSGNDDSALARQINRRLLPLHLRLFVEANPIPVKWALQQMGRIQGGIRLPLTELDPRHHDTIRSALVASGVLA